MTRIALLLSVTVLVGITPGASAIASGPEPAVYSWAVDGTPFGPNSSAAVDGTRIELSGDGTLSGQTVDGGGSYRLLDAQDREIASGAWRVSSLVRFEDQGPFVEGIALFTKGIVAVDAVFDGLGTADVTIFCDAEPGETEGVSIHVRDARYDAIVHGSTTLARDGGLYASLVSDGGVGP